MKPDTYFRFPGRPPCTANATDASGSVEPPFDSSAETEGASQTPTPSPQPKHGEITSHGASSAQLKKRGRPRKSPASHE